MVLLGSWCQRGAEQPQDWWISLIVDEWNGVTAIKYKLALRVGGFWRKTCFPRDPGLGAFRHQPCRAVRLIGELFYYRSYVIPILILGLS